MAQRLFLTNNDGSEIINLLSGVLKVTNWGWDTQPTALQQRITQLPFGIQASSLGYPQVVETLAVMASGCQDDIRDAIRQLEEFLENAKAYMDDPVYHDPHWLQWQSEGEDEKRSLICGGTWQWVHSPPSSWPMIDGDKLLLRLAMTRHPLWEDVNYASNWSVTDGLSSVGGTLSFNTDGRVPARIAATEMSCDDVSVYSDAITTLWMGFRPKYWGLSSFNPVWECESTANGGYSTLDVDTADNADGTSSSGFHALTTFADTDMDRRLYINVYTVNGLTRADAADFAGRYLVLCRCWIGSAGQSATIQMKSGYGPTPLATLTVHEPIVIDHSDALYVEMGQIQIPPPGIWDSTLGITGTTTDDQCSDFTIELWAQSIDADTMAWDTLVLIPCDYFVKVEDAYLYYLAGDFNMAIIRNPDERLFAYNHVDTGGNYAIRSATVAANQWYIPPGDSLLVVAAQRADEQVIADDLTGVFAYYPRWTSYRE